MGIAHRIGHTQGIYLTDTAALHGDVLQTAALSAQALKQISAV